MRPAKKSPGATAPVLLPTPCFDLALTLASGQIFHACELEGWWHVLVGREPLVVRQAGESIDLACGEPGLAQRYFAFDHPLNEIYAAFPDDPYSRAALEACRGLRILRQPAWECLATFITSSMKQVAHIRAMSLALRSRFGESIEGSPVEAYPPPQVLASASEDDLRACGLGFRARNLLATARVVAEGGFDPEAARALPTTALRERLCALPGVGRKVANCVLLFAYERLDAVPVDVWIGRIAVALRGRRLPAPRLEAYVARKFGRYAGYVQQYLFHHARTTGKLPTR